MEKIATPSIGKTIRSKIPDDNIFAVYAAAGISRAEIFDSAASTRAVLSEG